MHLHFGLLVELFRSSAGGDRLRWLPVESTRLFTAMNLIVTRLGGRRIGRAVRCGPAFRLSAACTYGQCVLHSGVLRWSRVEKRRAIVLGRIPSSASAHASVAGLGARHVDLLNGTHQELTHLMARTLRGSTCLEAGHQLGDSAHPIPP